MSASEGPVPADGQTPGTEGREPDDVVIHSAVVGPVRHQSNQAERAAMHPDGDDVEWHYYHGGWSG